MEVVNGMTVWDIVKEAIGYLLALSAIVEITPIKINPWSAILNWLGKKLNGELTEKVDILEKSVTDLKESTSEQQAINCRIRILRFGDEIRLNVKHTKEHFDQILQDMDFYDNYCAAHPKFKNNMTLMTEEHIRDTYRECMDKNSFLR